MRKKLRMGRTATVATAAALLAGGAGAYAAIPDSQSGTIDACYDNATGAVKVIDRQTGATCPSGSTSLRWNQQGRQGPTGMRGPQGSPGPNTMHWLRLKADGTIKNSGEAVGNWSVMDYGDYQLIKNSAVDVTQCAVFGTPYGYHKLVSVSRYSDSYSYYGNWVIVIENGTDPNGWVDVDVDLTFSCNS